MFTGIIEHLCQLQAIEPLSKGVRYIVKHSDAMPAYKTGDSIAVNGVCLTVVEFNQQHVVFDVSPETLEKTNLGHLPAGAVLHLELPVSLSKPLGGHFVLGHVDEVLQVKDIAALEDFTRLTITGVSHPEWVCEKGSITLDGVSLTINGIPNQQSIECMLIPHTLELTRFKNMKPGDALNVEYDYIAKIVAKNARSIYK